MYRRVASQCRGGIEVENDSAWCAIESQLEIQSVSRWSPEMCSSIASGRNLGVKNTVSSPQRCFLCVHRHVLGETQSIAI